MSRASRAVTAATAASLSLLAVGLIARPMVGSGSSAGSPSTTTAVPTTAATVDASVVSTAENSSFTDGAAASLAAEELIGAYVDSQYGVAVTDPACSEPASGAIAEEFVCYALKSGDLVIALRATIDEDRLIALELITNQQPTTTSSTTTTTATTEPAETATTSA